MKIRTTLIQACILVILALAAFSIPVAKVQAQSDINLTGYTLTFADEFNSLSVTTSSPKGASTWYYWPPYGAAGAYSASQWDANAFSVSGGILSNKAWLDASNNWHSGNLSSMDTTHAGFSQQYGYFEIRCQIPNSGTGAWPAFWLAESNWGSGVQGEEIDIFEWYGVCNTPGNLQAVIQEASHNWNTDGSQNQTLPYLYSPGTPLPGGFYPWQGYHIYGCQVDPAHITWYIDGVKTNQISTPTSYLTAPFYVMIDYALGGGWPLTGMVNNSSLNVDWVRVYSLPPAAAPTITSALTASGTVGNAFSYQITASNSPTSYNAIGLPGGLSVNTSTGLISGTPNASGTFNVGLSASNTNGTGMATLVLTVNSSGNPNLALNKPATASSLESTSYPASNAVDGNLSTRWSSQFSDPQWIYVDLGATHSINEVKLTWENAYASAYQIQVSNDASAWTTIYSTTTGTGGVNDLTGLSGSGRYVRMYGTQRGTGWGYSLWELAVYGSSTSTSTPVSINLAGSNTAQQLQPADVAGAPGYAVANWNVFTGANKTTSSLLKDSTGSTAAGVTLSSFASATASLINSGSGLTPNQKLFAGEIQAYYAGSPAVTVSSIPYSNYDVVVYLESDQTGRTGTVSLSGSPTTYYYSTVGGSGQPASYIQVTSTNGTYMTGNYVVYANQSGSSKTISLTPSNWSGICGIQIIPH
ncbi:MAG: discoidin domain-containing protein [Methylacidiphilales bacterium]|nr:discoidin domain-containing protein [Candidatus Methylacidiphilales bacterium]